ncbi:hypothetical protein DL96DRAFT_1816907 [Flagelloscypha sp. PMI_526]|nr:hypothetical protein DL96DRAFT_1816907 [Flagelloscypha sp. PMI_526]
MPSTYKQIVLAERPGYGNAVIPSKHFRTEEKSYAELVGNVGDDEVVVKVQWLSMDPAMRGWLNDARSYIPPVQIGEIMRAGAIAEVVVAGKTSGFKEADIVYGGFGWTEYRKYPAKDVKPITIPPGAEPVDFLNTLGMPGLTAYFGLYDVGKLKAGETLLVSGAAGAVGSLVCQLGIKTGAKVYALAGNKDKCEWLEKDIGVTKALNYKDADFNEQFKKLPYIDVYFDNVGGEILDMVFTRLQKGARIPFCGSISGYNSPPTPLKNYQNLIGQRARLEGFIVFDYADKFGDAVKELAQDLIAGTIKRKFHIVEGLEEAPAALPMLFSGGNTGKLVVKVLDRANL